MLAVSNWILFGKSMLKSKECHMEDRRMNIRDELINGAVMH